MLKSILLKAVPVPKIDQFERYLFVGPHPDDIEVACGATVAKLVSLGKKVTFIVCTDGRIGSLDESLTSEQIVEIRRQEALASAKLLGVDDVVFLPFHDGGNYTADELANALVPHILQMQPQMVFCPDHTVPSECHPDHLKTGQAVTKAVFLASWPKLTAQLDLEGSAPNINLAYYYTHKPNRYFGIKKFRKVHLDAIACHKSQFDENNLKVFKTYFGVRQLRFGLRSGKGRADGYRVLSPTHQHCFPEIAE